MRGRYQPYRSGKVRLQVCGDGEFAGQRAGLIYGTKDGKTLELRPMSRAFQVLHGQRAVVVLGWPETPVLANDGLPASRFL